MSRVTGNKWDAEAGALTLTPEVLQHQDSSTHTCVFMQSLSLPPWSKESTLQKGGGRDPCLWDLLPLTSLPLRNHSKIGPLTHRNGLQILLPEGKSGDIWELYLGVELHHNFLLSKAPHPQPLMHPAFQVSQECAGVQGGSSTTHLAFLPAL